MDFVLFQMPKLAVQPVLRNNVNIKRNISEYLGYKVFDAASVTMGLEHAPPSGDIIKLESGGINEF